MPDQPANYITTDLFRGRASNAGAWAGETPEHTNMIYHQIMLVASGDLAAGVYHVCMSVYEGDVDLEATVDTGAKLTIAGGNSALAAFTGAIRGVHLKVGTALSSGQTISCVLTSAMYPFGALV